MKLERKLLNNFYFVEPSKVGTQHITLLDGYLKVFLNAKLAENHNFNLKLRCSKSLHKNLSHSVQSNIDFHPIWVLDPHHRLFFLNTLMEFLNIFWLMLTKRKGDKILVTCMLSTSLFLLEIMTHFLNRENVFIAIHAEAEALTQEEKREKVMGYGYWFWKWWNTRSNQNAFNLVVLDDFIKGVMLSSEGPPIDEDKIIVFHHPLEMRESILSKSDVADLKICFIGYQTHQKGFDVFLEMSKKYPKHKFVAIGNGKIVNVVDRKETTFSNTEDFRSTISNCDVAMFPYSGGYDISLSAAALDAIASGLLMITSNRIFFKSLEAELSSDFVKIYETEEELTGIMERLSGEVKELRGERIARARKSKYSIEKISNQVSFFFPSNSGANAI